MDLRLANRGLLSFDASTLTRGSEETSLGVSSFVHNSVLSGLLNDGAPPTESLDLSQNAIHTFLGGDKLRCLTSLDLSFNALTTLRGSILPPLLIRLNLSHNQLTDLGELMQWTPKLEDLDVSHNGLSSLGLEHLPPSLTELNISHNHVETLNVLHPLVRLMKLNADSNTLRDWESVRCLGRLRSLRNLDLRHNPLTVHADSVSRVLALLPRLAHFNGHPLSQAACNSMYKALHDKTSKGGTCAPFGSSSKRCDRPRHQHEQSRSPSNGHSSLRSGSGRSQRKEDESSLILSQMQTKLKEQRKLLALAMKEEQDLKQQRSLLAQQVKGCADVINSQAMEMEEVQREIAELQSKDASLTKPMADLEQTFESTHASLLAHKVCTSQGGVK